MISFRAKLRRMPRGLWSRLTREVLVPIQRDGRLAPSDVRFLGRFKTMAWFAPARAKRIATNAHTLARYIDAVVAGTEHRKRELHAQRKALRKRA